MNMMRQKLLASRLLQAEKLLSRLHCRAKDQQGPDSVPYQDCSFRSHRQPKQQQHELLCHRRFALLVTIIYSDLYE